MQLSSDEIDQVDQLLDAVEAADGDRPDFRNLAAPHPDQTFLLAEDQVLVGLAQLTGDGADWALRLTVHPEHRGPGSTVMADLIDRAVAMARQRGGGQFHLWVSAPGDEQDQLAARYGLSERRDLYQMRIPLPVGVPWELTTRPFRPGVDEAAWLRVNNRAFSWHPEQGGWDTQTVKAHEAEEWFDPEGFLLHEQDGQLAGFCWTKIHIRPRPPLGEIYVIAVDPDFQGTGLGRKLVLAGLDHLASKGLTIGMLYVDAVNTPAVQLYLKMGFTIHHVDRAYTGPVT